MSWSNHWVGKPEAVAKAIDAYDKMLIGQSKMEFDSVKEHLKALVLTNSNESVIALDAKGHSWESSKGDYLANVEVALKRIGRLVE